MNGHAALSGAKLNEIPAEEIASFIEKQRQAKYEVSSINRALQVLRRVFHLAVDWGKVEKLPAKVSLVPGERRRERVLSQSEEQACLKAAGEIGDSIPEAHEKALRGIRATQRGQRPQQPEDRYLLRDVASSCSIAACVLKSATGFAGSTSGAIRFMSHTERRSTQDASYLCRNARAKCWSGAVAENRRGCFRLRLRADIWNSPP